jgi:malate permease and related proteins
MLHSEIIIHQITILGIMVLVGVIGTKAKIIDQSLKDGIARLVFNITLPLMIITTYAKTEMTTELLLNGALVVVLSLISFFVLFLLGAASTRLQGMNSRQGTINTLHTMFGNSVFLGFPLLNALFPGGEAIFYATLFFLVSNSVMWTFGVYIFCRDKSDGTKANLRQLLNPNTISFVVGIFIMLVHFEIPEVVMTPLYGMGQTTNYLSMLYIGAMLAQTNIRGTIARRSIYILSFNKLIAGPALLAVFFVVVMRVFHIEISPLAFSVVILEAGMPCMALVVVLAKKFGADDYLATENLFVSTLLSILTLPMLYYFIEFILSI